VRALISGVVFIVVLVALVWSFPPPFPTPGSLLDKSYVAIAAQLGAPADIDQNAKLPSALRSGKSVAWVKGWPFAAWTLQIDYRLTSFGPEARPDSVSRCLESKWSWVNWFLPCEAIFRARIRVS